MNKLKENLIKLKRCTPLPAAILIGMALFSVPMMIAFSLSPSFSDFFNRYIANFFRYIFALLSGILPFSLAETLIMLLPLILAVLVVLVIKTSKKTLSDMVRLTVSLFSVLAFLFSAFTLGFASGYRGSTLDEKLALKRETLSADDLYDTAEILLAELNVLCDRVEYKYGSFSVMPYTLREMNEKLMDAFTAASGKYDFLPHFNSSVKPIILSEPMTYTHISGVYTYFTGEANINTNFPDYTLPYTAAHELCHQRGIAREDEANFMAFLVCMLSEDDYIRYSGYLGVYEYVISALYSASSDKYYEIIGKTDMKIRYEMSAYNEFFEKYRDNVVADISGAINDSYLSSQGQSAGRKSYGMVVDLAAAYYKSKK